MKEKIAYLWGTMSNLSASLAALLVSKGWQIHIATKSSWNLLSLLPLDLHSAALASLEEAFGGREKFRLVADRFKLIDESEISKGTKYDALIFCGLPANFDEARTPRASWAADKLPALMKAMKGVPIFLISSIWGGVQPDRVVPEEFEFQRRKPLSDWERVCQHYENKLLSALAQAEAACYLVRVPMICGATGDGRILNFSGLYNLFKVLSTGNGMPDNMSDSLSNNKNNDNEKMKLSLAYNPNGCCWFLPVDTLAHMIWRLMEDENRPRICNLVSTQLTLNREWLQHLAESLGGKEIAAAASDLYTIPSVLRKLLMDDVQVKTRNLFEVSGRYHLPALKLDKEYFERVINYAKNKHWGLPLPAMAERALCFSEDLADYYFKNYLPAKLSGIDLEKLTGKGASIGFMLKGRDFGFILKSANGRAIVELLKRTDPEATVSLHFTGATMVNLIQSKLSLQRALLFQEVHIKGSIFDTVRVSAILDKFMKANPISPVELPLSCH